MGFCRLTGATVRAVPTEQAYRSNIANVELEADNPPLFRPHDDDVMRNEVILFEKSFSDFENLTMPTVHLTTLMVPDPSLLSLFSLSRDRFQSLMMCAAAAERLFPCSLFILSSITTTSIGKVMQIVAT